jgi:hypothetical protein
VAGTGTPLGDIPFFRHAADKLAGDDDVLIMLHTLFFGSAGKHTMRKRQLRLFAGFPEDSPSRSTLVDKVTNSKKWTLALLKSAAGLFGVEKSGTRDELIGRFVDFIISPTELKDVPAAKKTKTKTKKRKVVAGKKTKKDKSDTPKRAPSPYILFTLAKREEIKAKNPEATFGEVAKLLGAAWKTIGEKEKAVFVAASAAAAAAAAAAGGEETGGKKKRRKTEAVEEEEEEEEGSDDDDEEEEEEGGEEDRDKDLFPDSDDEA